MKAAHFSVAAKTTVPVLFGYLAIGIPFGLMTVNAGYPWWFAPIMSVLVFAGAGQYMAIGLFSAGASLGTIVIAELLINIRHIFYGLSLISKFKNVGKWKPILIFTLTDETYSLLTTCTVPEGCDAGNFYGAIALLDHAYWITGSLIGAVAGTLIPFSFEGVDFALTSLFAVLLISQIEKTKDVFPPVIGAAATLVAIIAARIGFLPSQHILLVSLVLGITVLIFVRGGAARTANTTSAGEGASTASSTSDIGARTSDDIGGDA